MQEFITIPTYLIREMPKDKLYALLDILSMADENGEFCSTTRKLMNRWNWGSGKTVYFLKELEERNIIGTKTERKRNTIISINKDFFDVVRNTNGTKAERKQNAKKQEKEQEQSKEQAVKKEKVYYPNDELLDSAFKEFLVMRNKIKKPIATKQALTRMMNKIQKLSGGDNDLAIKILNQSTDHCWQDVYKLKEGDNNGRIARNDTKNIRDPYAEEFERLLNE